MRNQLLMRLQHGLNYQKVMRYLNIYFTFTFNFLEYSRILMNHSFGKTSVLSISSAPTTVLDFGVKR